MKKLLTLIVVVALVSGTQAAILPQAQDIAFGWQNMELLNVNADCEKGVFITEAAIYLQYEDGSAYIVILATVENRHQSAALAGNLSCLTGGNIIIEPQQNSYAANASFIEMIPESRTIAALALAGLLWRRRRNICRLG